jgi:hypothetical protein
MDRAVQEIGGIGSDAYGDDHIANNFVVRDEVRVLLLCFKEAVQEVVCALAQLKALYALLEVLHRKPSHDREVVEFIKGSRPFGILAKSAIED